MPIPKDLMTPQETADLLKVTVGTVYNWISSQKIPVFYIKAGTDKRGVPRISEKALMQNEVIQYVPIAEHNRGVIGRKI